MNVTAVIVTRGDVPLSPVIEPFPPEWQVLVWDNGAGELCERANADATWECLADDLPDLAVYGRYAALPYAAHSLCYVQDDDCVVDDPTAIAALSDILRDDNGERSDAVVCNQPREFRHPFYEHHSLVGFGAAFPRDLPHRIFDTHPLPTIPQGVFDRTCDIVFTGLTRRWLVDVAVRSLPYASDPNRMWKQPTHQSERAQVLEIVKSLAAEQAIA
jgi:hypothetical protein